MKLCECGCGNEADIERLGGVCFVCGQKDEKELAVHHVFYDVSMMEMRGLVALCGECHANTNVKSSKALWVFYFSKRLSEDYGYTYEDMSAGGELREVNYLLRSYGPTKILV